MLPNPSRSSVSVLARAGLGAPPNLRRSISRTRLQLGRTWVKRRLGYALDDGGSLAPVGAATSFAVTHVRDVAVPDTAVAQPGARLGDQLEILRQRSDSETMDGAASELFNRRLEVMVTEVTELRREIPNLLRSLNSVFALSVPFIIGLASLTFVERVSWIAVTGPFVLAVFALYTADAYVEMAYLGGVRAVLENRIGEMLQASPDGSWDLKSGKWDTPFVWESRVLNDRLVSPARFSLFLVWLAGFGITAWLARVQRRLHLEYSVDRLNWEHTESLLVVEPRRVGIANHDVDLTRDIAIHGDDLSRLRHPHRGRKVALKERRDDGLAGAVL